MADGIDLLEGLATTRAIRRYLPDPIPEDDLAKLAFAASRAPTGSNRQSYRMLFLRDGPKAIEARRALARAARYVWGDKREADGYGGAAADSPKARMARTMEHFVEHFGDAPLVILPCLVRYREPTPTEGASIYPRLSEPAPRRQGPRVWRRHNRLA